MTSPFLGTGANALTYTATPASLATTFAAVGSGDTIRLVGDFGYTRLQYRSFTRTVTIDASKASFNDTLNLNRLDNVKVWGGKWNVTAGSAYGRAILVIGGSHVTLDRTSIIGVDAQQGINFNGTSFATVTNGTFDGLHTAVGFGSVTNGVASKNKVLRATSDGIDIADSHFVTASYNSCTLGNPAAGVHPDCIQLWSTAGREIQSDIKVINNYAAGPTQGFTSFANGGGGLRLQISRNTVITSVPQGVACYDCISSDISYNTLTTQYGAAHATNLNVIGGSRNRIIGNVFRYLDIDGVSHERALAAEGILPSELAASGSAAAVPEPSAWLLLIGGFAAVGAAARRRHQGVRSVAA